MIGLFSKGGEAVHFSSQGMTNIYMQHQQRVSRQQLHYPAEGSWRGDEAPLALISGSHSRDASCFVSAGIVLFAARGLEAY